jgi:hypothetical protein
LQKCADEMRNIAVGNITCLLQSLCFVLLPSFSFLGFVDLARAATREFPHHIVYGG